MQNMKAKNVKRGGKKLGMQKITKCENIYEISSKES
jgi:hypothetical protein